LQIPTLDEALSALPDGVVMAIEVKDPRAAVPAIAEIRRHGVEGRVLLWAKSAQAVRVFARELPHTERALLRDTWSARANRRFLEDATDCDADAVSAHWNRITPGFVADAHAMGLRVYSMTRDAGDPASRLATGLDGVITDWPELALATVRDGLA
jgi:glycerophosphoryl diester phosphodiesterase